MAVLSRQRQVYRPSQCGGGGGGSFSVAMDISGLLVYRKEKKRTNWLMIDYFVSLHTFFVFSLHIRFVVFINSYIFLHRSTN
jgi:hypothetical protein